MVTEKDAPGTPGAAFTERIDVPPAAGFLDAQASFFDREGCLVLRGVLGRDELAALDRGMTDLSTKHATTPRIGEGDSPNGIRIVME